MWHSQTLNQNFINVQTQPTTLQPRYRGGTRLFTGYKAYRQTDHAPALVNLTKKPTDYPYDFVLL